MQAVQSEPSRTFRVNQNVSMNIVVKNNDITIALLVEGYSDGETVIISYHEVKTMTKPVEKFLSQFKCLNPNGQLTRLYLIPEKTLRQYVEQGKAIKGSKKRT